MLLHYVVSLVAAPSFATEGRSLPSFQAIAHPSVLSSVGVSFFLCFHQTVSNRQRNVFGEFFDLCSDWTQIPSSSPHSGSHHPESTSWKTDSPRHPPVVLAFCFRPEQISESRRLFPRLHRLVMSFICSLLTSDLRPDQLYWFLRGVFLECRHKSPEFPVQKVLQNKHRSLYFCSCSSSWSNSSIIANTPWLDFAPQVSMTTQPEGFNGEWAS